MDAAWVVSTATGTLGGAFATPMLTGHGLAQLKRSHIGPRGLWLTSVAGCAAGAAAVEASRHAGTWWVLPALLLWACALVAAASCDAVTQRIPTPLVRQAGVGTGVLLIGGLAVHDDWRGLVLSAAGALTAGLALLLCWRFAGAGFGDVRLAILGGLGLGHATYRALVLGLVVFCVITLVQAGGALAHGRDRQTALPYGPALAMGMLVAATF